MIHPLKTVGRLLLRASSKKNSDQRTAHASQMTPKVKSPATNESNPRYTAEAATKRENHSMPSCDPGKVGNSDLKVGEPEQQHGEGSVDYRGVSV